jgi:V8-like Glu-specific endopeptidase
MKRALPQKLISIQKHISRNFKRWFKSYSGIEGVHVGLKRVKGEIVQDCYSVIFHVNKKKKAPKKKVPAYINVTLKDNEKLKVPTDVIEAGKIKFNGIKIGDFTKNENAGLVGTISFYFSTASGVYLSSNMHVLAPRLLNNGQIHYDVRKGDPAQSILLFNDIITSTAQLIVAVFNGIDFALAKVDNPQSPQIIERIIKEAGPVGGVLGLNYNNYKTVVPSFYGITSKFQNCTISDLGVIKNTKFAHVFLTNLIKLEKCTQSGDSGAPLFDQQNRLMGVIVGDDRDGSYALHINDITDFFQSSKL